MIQVQTLFRVCDNSGAKKVRCIKVCGRSGRSIARCGDLILVSVQKVKHHKKKKVKIKEGEVHLALVLRTRSKIRRQNSSFFGFQENLVALLTPKKKPLASRILGPVAKELRHSKYLKIASLSSGLI